LLNPLGYPVTTLDAAIVEGGPAALSRRFAAEADELAAASPSLAAAAGAALLYLEQTFGRELGHLKPPRLYRAAEYMMVDETSRRHLELVISSDGAKKGSLLWVLDESATAIGSRTLNHWILYPLLDPAAIAARHDAVEELFDADLGGEIEAAMRRIGDL